VNEVYLLSHAYTLEHSLVMRADDDTLFFS
jgi:hypothetical protein